MQVTVSFQRLFPGSKRPEDCQQDDVLEWEDTDSIPLPLPEDSVTLRYGGEMTAYKVLTRHFSYVSGVLAVNIVVESLSADEYGRRVKK